MELRFFHYQNGHEVKGLSPQEVVHDPSLVLEPLLEEQLLGKFVIFEVLDETRRFREFLVHVFNPSSQHIDHVERAWRAGPEVTADELAHWITYGHLEDGPRDPHLRFFGAGCISPQVETIPMEDIPRMVIKGIEGLLFSATSCAHARLRGHYNETQLGDRGRKTLLELKENLEKTLNLKAA